MKRAQIISKLIKHRRFHFPGGQPFACYGHMRVFGNAGRNCVGTISPDRCMESTQDLQSSLDWYETNNWRKG